jgi:hypothetical protein
MNGLAFGSRCVLPPAFLDLLHKTDHLRLGPENIALPHLHALGEGIYLFEHIDHVTGHARYLLDVGTPD